MDSVSNRKHAIANLITYFTTFSTSGDGGERRWSNTSLSATFSTADVDRKVTKSPGCFPLITSSANTPKLNTSHFSVTFIV
ncbi:hypothetical protein RHGRI_021530 [Rhododendron griersonianum]|uniref:Uncharacterized protein n=1 Tax=Rhododendron griersonianum TaxID=479676 RepID=A0AAV6JME2_9ERIC|nr:hypothetical protein RHGRI_021530 [Rhododendron griersonianum]